SLPPRWSSAATSSRDASETLSAAGYPNRTSSNSTDTPPPDGTVTAPGFSLIIGGRSSTSKTRSNDTNAVMTSTRTLANAVNGEYSRVSSNASATTVPGAISPVIASQPPSPYTRAVASADTSVRLVMNHRVAMALRTPMS